MHNKVTLNSKFAHSWANDYVSPEKEDRDVNAKGSLIIRQLTHDRSLPKIKSNMVNDSELLDRKLDFPRTRD